MATLPYKMSKLDVDSDGFQKVKTKRNNRSLVYRTKLKHLTVEIEKNKVIDVVKTTK